MTEEIVNAIINNPALLEKLAAKVYDKLKNDIIIQRLDRLEDILKTIQQHYVEHTGAIEKLQEQVSKHNQILMEHSKVIEKLQEQVTKHTQAIQNLQEQIMKHTEAIEKLQEYIIEQSKVIQNLQIAVSENTKAISKLNKRLSYAERYIDLTSIGIEEEGREFIRWKVEKELGIKLNVTIFEVEGKIEFDIFAEHENFVIIGEVKTRVKGSTVEKFMKKVEKLKEIKPEITKKRMVLVIYGIGFNREAIEKCKENNIYATNGFYDYTEFPKLYV
ncbi:MAG: hypothetical protein QXR34_08945 [Saccharolobus sp.]